MNVLERLRPRRPVLPDIERLQRCVDAVDMAADIAYPPFMETPRRHVVRTISNAQTMADFYAQSWLRDEVDAELFALEAAIAEEQVAQ